ncbi:MAG: hypothetical protein ACQKBY_12295 [Verrucomicrobiales bacterium]
MWFGLEWKAQPRGYALIGFQLKRRLEADSEGGQNEDTFNQCGQNDGDHEDRGGGAWVTTGGLSGFETEKTDADGGTEGGEGDCECFSEHGFSCLLFVVLFE